VPAGEPEVALTEAHFSGAGLILPRPADVVDWAYIEEPAAYTADTLAELIDGGGASYIELGFEQCAYAVLQMRQAPASIGRPVGLEIYVFRMTTPDAAQAKYQTDHEGSSCTPVPEITPTHCLTSSSLDVVTGPYYLRFNLDAQDPALLPPLVAVGRSVLERLAGLETTRPVVPGTGQGTGP
jgi:hypothetical protein